MLVPIFIYLVISRNSNKKVLKWINIKISYLEIIPGSNQFIQIVVNVRALVPITFRRERDLVEELSTTVLITLLNVHSFNGEKVMKFDFDGYLLVRVGV